MKTPVTIRVAVQDDWDAGTGLQVFTDRGSGSVDENAPLLGKPKAVFPGALAAEGYGAQPYGVGAYGANTPDAPRSGGYGDRVYGEADYGTSEPYVEVTANIPAAFGKWKFSVKAVDAEGNEQGDPAVEIAQMVSATAPPELARFGLASYDAPTDKLTFSISENTE